MLAPGTPIPAARVESVGGRVLDLQGLRGKRVLVWYEDKDSIAVNQRLKDALARQAASTGHGDHVVVAAVADVSDFDYFPARRIVKAAIAQQERSSGNPIYCDWSGQFAKQLGFARKNSNLLIIDPEGRVERAYQGAVPVADHDAIIASTAPA